MRHAILKLIILMCLAGVGPAPFVPTAQAGGADVVQTIDPLTLPPAQRAQVLNARIGRRGPFGDLAPHGCKWSRMQIPTPQGLRWVAEEICTEDLSGGR